MLMPNIKKSLKMLKFIIDFTGVSKYTKIFILHKSFETEAAPSLYQVLKSQFSNSGSLLRKLRIKSVLKITNRFTFFQI